VSAWQMQQHHESCGPIYQGADRGSVIFAGDQSIPVPVSGYRPVVRRGGPPAAASWWSRTDNRPGTSPEAASPWSSSTSPRGPTRAPTRHHRAAPAQAGTGTAHRSGIGLVDHSRHHRRPEADLPLTDTAHGTSGTTSWMPNSLPEPSSPNCPEPMRHSLGADADPWPTPTSQGGNHRRFGSPLPKPSTNSTATSSITVNPAWSSLAGERRVTAGVVA
jgi:hypothetical protein